MKKHIKTIYLNRKENVVQVIQKNNQSIISEKSHGIVKELTYNIDQSINNEITTTSEVKNSM